MSRTDLESLIPHSPPMLFLETVLRHDAGGVDCAASIPPANPFVRDGTAPAYVGLEMAAQAAAALEALDRASSTTRSPAPKIGYLVGIRDARFHVSRLPAATCMEARVRPAGGAPPLSLYHVQIRRGDTLCLEATISTYITDDDLPQSR